jgi:hypothetical protein
MTKSTNTGEGANMELGLRRHQGRMAGSHCGGAALETTYHHVTSWLRSKCSHVAAYQQNGLKNCKTLKWTDFRNRKNPIREDI